MTVNLMEMMTMFNNKENVIKPPCETNTMHCYVDNNVDNDGNQDLQYVR